MTNGPRLGISGVYAIVHIASGKLYVGSAKCIAKRWQGHRSELGRGIHHSPLLQRAWNKYGSGAFAFVIIRFCPEDQLIPIEQKWMDEMEVSGKRGYNCRSLAESNRGYKYPKDICEKMSRSRKESPYLAIHSAKLSERMKGVPKSPEQREAMSRAQRGRKRTPEQIAKQANAIRGRKQSPEHIAKSAAARKGKPRSPEAIAKLVAANTGVKFSPERRAKLSEARRRRPPPSQATKDKTRATFAAKRRARQSMVQGELFD